MIFYFIRNYSKFCKISWNNLFSILVVVDDFADDQTFTRQSKLLHSLFTRGRHNTISTIVSTQKSASCHPIIRLNSTALIVYRLRDYKELEAFVEEVSGVITKTEFVELYKYATEAEYSFLYVNLVAKTVKEMFFFTKTLIFYNWKMRLMSDR